jgi:catechol 2,3-dioxygenase-like lactoylglutathione lyase family enzyme
MTSRVHIHLKAVDLNASRQFYRQFFGCDPVKDKVDQVKFLPDLAPLNLTISPAGRDQGEAPAVDHLGIEVSSGARSPAAARPRKTRWHCPRAAKRELLLRQSDQVLGDRSGRR